MQTKHDAKLFKVTDTIGTEVYVIAKSASDAAQFREKQLLKIEGTHHVSEVAFVTDSVFLAPGSYVDYVVSQ